jgi:hypothetical protein
VLSESDRLGSFDLLLNGHPGTLDYLSFQSLNNWDERAHESKSEMATSGKAQH